MITVIIEDNGEDRVTQLTYENLWKELKDIPGAELFILEDWFSTLGLIKNKYVCFVEADCLVSSGYFVSQLSLLKKDPYFRKLAMLTSVTSVNDWANRFYGYKLDVAHENRVTPVLQKRSGLVDAIQIAYFPGSIIRVNMLKKALMLSIQESIAGGLIAFSTALSLAFWRQGDGNRIHLNPNATYLTTEKYVNDLGKFKVDAADLIEKFERESI